MFAIDSAHNLLAAALDDTLHRGGDIDAASIAWRRVLDIDDRSLRQVRTGLGQSNGPDRERGVGAGAERMDLFESVALVESARLHQIIPGVERLDPRAMQTPR